MQTKKKANGRNREHASPRVLRAAKKASENIQFVETKVADLITSSVRKKKSVTVISEENGESIEPINLNTRYGLRNDESSGACLGYDLCNEVSLHQKDYDEEAAPPVMGTIFSPSFHVSKVADGDTVNGGRRSHEESEMEYSLVNMWDGHVSRQTTESTFEGEKTYNAEGANLSSEVSAIYLAMKNSKLECVDENGQESMSVDVCMEDNEYEDFDDFDPYLFIKNLPELSSVVPTFRPMLLPKQTRSCPPITLVLDLDETLVHSSLEPCDDADFTFPVNFNLQKHTVYVRCRPHLKDFLERVSSIFEIIIFTASQSIYAEQLLNVLDPKRKIFRHRVYRESCVFVEGNYLKDLSVLGRDLSHVIIVDNSPQAFGFQVNNGIPIESWFDDRSDQELLLLLPFLESLIGLEDVRPVIAQRFNLQKKIAAAVYPPLRSNRGDPFAR